MKKKKKLEKNKFGKILPTDGVFWFDGIGLRRLARGVVLRPASTNCTQQLKFQRNIEN
jgi:hypothetical protein